jgi:hypothetical protein
VSFLLDWARQLGLMPHPVEADHYYLSYDVVGGGHWYVVPLSRRKEWGVFLERTGLGTLSAAPRYARWVHDPSDVAFRQPKFRQYGDARQFLGEWY